MSALDGILSATVTSGAAPFVLGMVSNSDGVLWQGSAGDAKPGRPASADTVLSLFSCTKAIGSLMAVMAIDRGLFTMDTPVGEVLPAFDDLKVLTGMDGDKPLYREPRTRATIRHLLTHTSGMGYKAFYPLQEEYAQKTGAHQDLEGTWESLNYPLLFDPGEGFAYGIGTDWVGAVVSAADGRSVEAFVREEILGPLGMPDTYFERDEVGDRLADLVLRGPDGGFLAEGIYPPSRPEIYHMGNALYSTAADYMTFLRFVLNRGVHDGRRLVSAEAMDLMFSDQAGMELPSPVLTSYEPKIKDCDPCPGVRKTHTAAFVRSEEDVPGGRRAGSLAWCGFHNTHYWIDPSRGIAALFMTQLLPLFDEQFMEHFYAFERAVSLEFGA